MTSLSSWMLLGPEIPLGRAPSSCKFGGGASQSSPKASGMEARDIKGAMTTMFLLGGLCTILHPHGSSMHVHSVLGIMPATSFPSCHPCPCVFIWWELGQGVLGPCFFFFFFCNVGKHSSLCNMSGPFIFILRQDFSRLPSLDTT